MHQIALSLICWIEVGMMLPGLLFGLVTLLSFIGLISLMYYIAIRVLYARGEERYYVVIPASADLEDVAGLLYAAQLRLNLFGGCGKGRIVALDCGMAEEERTRCENLSRACVDLYVCKPEELAGLILDPG